MHTAPLIYCFPLLLPPPLNFTAPFLFSRISLFSPPLELMGLTSPAFINEYLSLSSVPTHQRPSQIRAGCLPAAEEAARPLAGDGRGVSQAQQRWAPGWFLTRQVSHSHRAAWDAATAASGGSAAGAAGAGGGGAAAGGAAVPGLGSSQAWQRTAELGLLSMHVEHDQLPAGGLKRSHRSLEPARTKQQQCRCFTTKNISPQSSTYSRTTLLTAQSLQCLVRTRTAQSFTCCHCHTLG